MTGGKIRLRNAEEKNWTDGNSAYAEKNDIITITGAVYAENQEKAPDAHASCRVRKINFKIVHNNSSSRIRVKTFLV